MIAPYVTTVFATCKGKDPNPQSLNTDSALKPETLNPKP